MNHKELGKLGEQYALKYLQKQGYQLIASNWRNRYGEIDIIMLSADNILVFIEVKLRTNNNKGTGLEAVDARKLHKIYQIAQMFLLRNRQYINYSVRVDVISIIYDKVQHQVKDIIHIKGS
jgi:putative endonuclease